jgi:hypothetical protein
VKSGTSPPTASRWGGRVQLGGALTTCTSRRPAGQLFDEAWPIVEATRQQMIELAREIGRARKWPLPSDGPAAVRAVFDQLSKDYPKSDAEMVSWYRDAAQRLVAYGRKTGMFDIPADYKLDVVETPPPLQASIDGAAYYPRRHSRTAASDGST